MTKEECHPTVPAMRTDESVPGAEKTVALGTGLARERRLVITGEPPKQAEDRKKPNPSACTGLAEHLLPRRHGLIQSFLRLWASADLTRLIRHICFQWRTPGTGRSEIYETGKLTDSFLDRGSGNYGKNSRRRIQQSRCKRFADVQSTG